MPIELTVPRFLVSAGARQVKKELEAARQRRLQSEYERLIGEVYAEVMYQRPGLSPAEAETEAAALATASTEVVDMLIDAFERMVRTLCPEAKPYVARLAAWYAVDGKVVDPFYRRMGRVLMDAEPADVAGLCSLSRMLSRFRDDRVAEQCTVDEAAFVLSFDGVDRHLVAIEGAGSRAVRNFAGRDIPWEEWREPLLLLENVRLVERFRGAYGSTGGVRYTIPATSWRGLGHVFSNRVATG